MRLSDKIAYINHDIDDAIRAQVLREEEIPTEYRRVLGGSTRERLDTLIHDMIISSQGTGDLHMSAEVEQAMQGLRKFMFVHVYQNPMAKGEERKAKALLERLFAYYMDYPEKMPEQFLQMMEEGETKGRVVCDYIAGMTDQYAIAKFEEYFMPKAWQVN